jgi:hypothetical protein
MCVRKNVCRRFLERCQSSVKNLELGRKGTGLGGYEDAEIAHCALDLGLGTGKSARLRLTHLIPASRLTLDYFLRHAEGDAASLMMFRALRGLPIKEETRASFFDKLVFYLHCFRHKVPKEMRLIRQAHQRGLEKGFLLVKKCYESQARSVDGGTK